MNQLNEVQQLHARRLELLVQKDNLEVEIADRQARLNATNDELAKVRHLILGTEHATRDFQNLEAARALAEATKEQAKSEGEQ